MGKIAEQKISTRRFCRYFVHALLCVGEAFHGFEPTSILVDGPGEDIEFEGAFHKYKGAADPVSTGGRTRRVTCCFTLVSLEAAVQERKRTP